ncbi:hypothetical protein RU87_GL001565 [Lactococcus plantarum]|uniref:Uncharacterized protein n=1 Tax=Pseudolactococcus plantarum TaxID=1365 RepID=A0A2A5RZN7_9LACT|nr:hypothetical protein RU87_GL001565 [Lactococcus plantarum]
MNVHFQLVDQADNDTDTAINAMLSFVIVLEDLVISGNIGQLSIIRGQVIENKEQLTQEDMSELATPLFDLLKRLTYEVTEVALDQPGISLEF